MHSNVSFTKGEVAEQYRIRQSLSDTLQAHNLSPESFVISRLRCILISKSLTEFAFIGEFIKILQGYEIRMGILLTTIHQKFPECCLDAYIKSTASYAASSSTSSTTYPLYPLKIRPGFVRRYQRAAVASQHIENPITVDVPPHAFHYNNAVIVSRQICLQLYEIIRLRGDTHDVVVPKIFESTKGWFEDIIQFYETSKIQEKDAAIVFYKMAALIGSIQTGICLLSNDKQQRELLQLSIDILKYSDAAREMNTLGEYTTAAKSVEMRLRFACISWLNGWYAAFLKKRETQYDEIINQIIKWIADWKSEVKVIVKACTNKGEACHYFWELVVTFHSAVLVNASSSDIAATIMTVLAHAERNKNSHRGLYWSKTASEIICFVYSYLCTTNTVDASTKRESFLQYITSCKIRSTRNSKIYAANETIAAAVVNTIHSLQHLSMEEQHEFVAAAVELITAHWSTTASSIHLSLPIVQHLGRLTNLKIPLLVYPRFESLCWTYAQQFRYSIFSKESNKSTNYSKSLFSYIEKFMDAIRGLYCCLVDTTDESYYAHMSDIFELVLVTYRTVQLLSLRPGSHTPDTYTEMDLILSNFVKWLPCNPCNVQKELLYCMACQLLCWSMSSNVCMPPWNAKKHRRFGITQLNEHFPSTTIYPICCSTKEPHSCSGKLTLAFIARCRDMRCFTRQSNTSKNLRDFVLQHLMATRVVFTAAIELWNCVLELKIQQHKNNKLKTCDSINDAINCAAEVSPFLLNINADKVGLDAKSAFSYLSRKTLSKNDELFHYAKMTGIAGKLVHPDRYRLEELWYVLLVDDMESRRNRSGCGSEYLLYLELSHSTHSKDRHQVQLAKLLNTLFSNRSRKRKVNHAELTDKAKADYKQYCIHECAIAALFLRSKDEIAKKALQCLTRLNSSQPDLLCNSMAIHGLLQALGSAYVMESNIISPWFRRLYMQCIYLLHKSSKHSSVCVAQGVLSEFTYLVGHSLNVKLQHTLNGTHYDEREELADRKQLHKHFEVLLAICQTLTSISRHSSDSRFGSYKIVWPHNTCEAIRRDGSFTTEYMLWIDLMQALSSLDYGFHQFTAAAPEMHMAYKSVNTAYGCTSMVEWKWSDSCMSLNQLLREAENEKVDLSPNRRQKRLQHLLRSAKLKPSFYEDGDQCYTYSLWCVAFQFIASQIGGSYEWIHKTATKPKPILEEIDTTIIKSSYMNERGSDVTHHREYEAATTLNGSIESPSFTEHILRTNGLDTTPYDTVISEWDASKQSAYQALLDSVLYYTVRLPFKLKSEWALQRATPVWQSILQSYNESGLQTLEPVFTKEIQMGWEMTFQSCAITSITSSAILSQALSSSDASVSFSTYFSEENPEVTRAIKLKKDLRTLELSYEKLQLSLVKFIQERLEYTFIRDQSNILNLYSRIIAMPLSIIAARFGAFNSRHIPTGDLISEPSVFGTPQSVSTSTNVFALIEITIALCNYEKHIPASPVREAFSSYGSSISKSLSLFDDIVPQEEQRTQHSYLIQWAFAALIQCFSKPYEPFLDWNCEQCIHDISGLPTFSKISNDEVANSTSVTTRSQVFTSHLMSSNEQTGTKCHCAHKKYSFLRSLHSSASFLKGMFDAHEKGKRGHGGGGTSQCSCWKKFQLPIALLIELIIDLMDRIQVIYFPQTKSLHYHQLKCNFLHTVEPSPYRDAAASAAQKIVAMHHSSSMNRGKNAVLPLFGTTYPVLLSQAKTRLHLDAYATHLCEAVLEVFCSNPRQLVSHYLRYPAGYTDFLELIVGVNFRTDVMKEAEFHMLTSNSDRMPIAMWIYLWQIPLQIILFLLWPRPQHTICMRAAACRAFDAHPSDAWRLYSIQLIQALRTDPGYCVEAMLVQLSSQSHLFAEDLYFALSAEAGNKQANDKLAIKCKGVMKKVLNSMNEERRRRILKQANVFNEICNLSGECLGKPPLERRGYLTERLKEISSRRDWELVSIPTKRSRLVLDVDYENAMMMKSAAKAPFLLNFLTCSRNVSEEEYDKYKNGIPVNWSEESGALPPVFTTETCIFKLNDDMRQDQLVLQIMHFCQVLFDRMDAGLWLLPYRVVSHRSSSPDSSINNVLGGIIECIPNSRSMHDLFKVSKGTLVQYFIGKYGPRHSKSFDEAVFNFIKSMAAYSVMTFLLRIKDRHNGNIMLLESGHVVHIDFGFVFDLAPQKDITVERAAFKLTKEMVELMGGTNSSYFKIFTHLCVKGFIALRDHSDHLLHMVHLMTHSGLPCFKTRSMSNLRDRFQLDKNIREASEYMERMVRDSCSSVYTFMYDVLQKFTNAIEF